MIENNERICLLSELLKMALIMALDKKIPQEELDLLDEMHSLHRGILFNQNLTLTEAHKRVQEARKKTKKIVSWRP